MNSIFCSLLFFVFFSPASASELALQIPASLKFETIGDEIVVPIPVRTDPLWDVRALLLQETSAFAVPLAESSAMPQRTCSQAGRSTLELRFRLPARRTTAHFLLVLYARSALSPSWNPMGQMHLISDPSWRAVFANPAFAVRSGFETVFMEKKG